MTEPQIFGTHEPKTLEQLRDVASRADRAALMADGHLGYVMPIGGVAAYRNRVSVVGVGFDIACGNAAIRTDRTRAQVAPHLRELADGIQEAISFGVGRKNRAWGERVPERETLLDVTSPVGDAYWQLMNLAGRYAYAGREWVTRKVVELLGGREQELVHNHHNFAWREEHGGEPFYVVRKGATPAFPGQKGFVGGSMGDDAVIIQGVASDSAEVRDLQARALYSTVHGAGRVMSRTAAAGKRTRRGKVTKPGAISREMMLEWVEQKGVVLRGGGADESPHVYRRLPEVLAAQGPTVEVLHVLHPLVVVMAGAEEFDPYKD